MNILICDSKEELSLLEQSDINMIRENLPDCNVELYPYANKKEFLEKIEKAEALLTAFLPVDAEVLRKAVKLKVICIMASGYNNIDIVEAKRRGIAVCTAADYCTQEVADHTMALLLALIRNLKHYERDIEERKIWNYGTVPGGLRLADSVLAIYGFGKIGKAVAQRALAFGVKVLVKDPYITAETAKAHGVLLAEETYIKEHAHIISNHMAPAIENKNYFNLNYFKELKQQPIFLNLGRGETVDEEALTKALDIGYISGAGLDVLKDEPPVLEYNPLLYRENIIITPHSAFYSGTSIMALKNISCMNLINYLKGNYSAIKGRVV
ncbi:NAD(P)-dependent oxidoreductase [Clostridium sp. KNHs205]|uniref:NAD(P)-dependent oxidoreductase n=1 Tax=Clostridium sp. KNHs205 TaxID=1449050 RepID=UPI00051BCE21|nr:NAD(P)-dependent oxidoreductase [Clostridium sp. KNHs205]